MLGYVIPVADIYIDAVVVSLMKGNGYDTDVEPPQGNFLVFF
jgi:hypothetical protein